MTRPSAYSESHTAVNLGTLMQITVNGEPREVVEGYSAAQLVADLGLADRRIAMEVNLEIVPRSGYTEYRFTPGDRVEVVQAIGGG